MPWTIEAQEGEGMGSMPKPGMELKYSKQPCDIGVSSPSHAYITGHATCDYTYKWENVFSLEEVSLRKRTQGNLTDYVCCARSKLM
jgi:hypothetical protein